MTDVRIGVVGVGSLGYHHARILADLEGVRMAGIFDVRSERAAEVEAALEVASHGALESLLDGADAVVVAVPTLAHEEVAVAALRRGLAVLIEKPMAPDLDAADRILEAAAEAAAVVQVGHIERFNAAVRAAEDHLDHPLFVESHRMAPFTPRSTDVAVVLDLMIHDVDLVRSLVGTPIREIAASGVPVLTPNVDIANARLNFEGGAVANLTASRISMERMRKIRIFQPSGYLSLDLAAGIGDYLRLRTPLSELLDAGGGISLDGGDGGGGVGEELTIGLEDIVERIPLEGDGVEPLRRELENFRDAVRGVADPAVSGQEGRAALEVTLAIEERIENHVAYSRPA